MTLKSPGHARRLLPCGVFLVVAAMVSASAAETGTWQVVKSQHFLVMHTGDEAFAQTVADKAESFYTTIADDLGYKRLSGFWQWDNRVKVLIYASATDFRAACQAPDWASGRANYKRHEIASYRQGGEAFLSGLLPHEMAHLILADFVGAERVPNWLTEGFSQWEQNGRPKAPRLHAGTRWFTLRELTAMDIREATGRDRVAVYYEQCASVVGFLIGTYGGERFGTFCRALRDGKSCAEALTAAYPDTVPTLDALEQAWRGAMQGPGR